MCPLVAPNLDRALDGNKILQVKKAADSPMFPEILHNLWALLIFYAKPER